MKARVASLGCTTASLVLLAASTHGFAACDLTHEGYHVMAYDARTHQYTIYRDGVFYPGKYMVKKIVAVCASFHWGERERVVGADACDLNVGQLIPSSRTARSGGFATVVESGNLLGITQGDGSDRTRQYFNILSVEVLPDSGCL
jgi:hypothetical protein